MSNVNKNVTNTNDTNNDNQGNNGSSDKIALYICLAVLAVVIVIAISSLTNCSNNPFSSTPATPTSPAITAAPVNIASESGNRKKVLDSKISVRSVDFSKSMKEVQAFEKKQKDTLDNPSTAKSTDGYTYITYSFNQNTAPKFFGIEVMPTSINAHLVYVFKNEDMIEVRIQYGGVPKSAYDKLAKTANKKYGTFVYNRTLTDGTDEKVWNTKDVCLDVVYQTENTVAYVKKN